MLPDLLDVSPLGTLDLHGMGVSEACAAVHSYVALWRRRHPGAVLHVITGKGRGSLGRPALRPAVRRLLRGALVPALMEWSPDVDDGGFLLRVR